jgi:hypothetical protein
MQVAERDLKDLKKLPDWVKCMKCHEGPKPHDWLIEVIKNTNVLIHQSCARKP